MAGERTGELIRHLPLPHQLTEGIAHHLRAAAIATLALAASGAAIVYASLAGDGRPSAVVTDAPRSGAPTEPQKAPEQNSNTPNLVTSPGFPGFENTTSAPPKPPEVIYWSAEAIKAAQGEATRNNKILLLDTWSEKGGKLTEAKNVFGRNALVITDLEAGPFNTPVSGKIVSIATEVLRGGIKFKSVDIQTANIITTIGFPDDADIRVKIGDILNTDTLLADIKTGLIPPGAGLSKKAQIAIISYQNQQTVENTLPISSENVLAQNGISVRLASGNS